MVLEKTKYQGRLAWTKHLMAVLNMTIWSCKYQGPFGKDQMYYEPNVDRCFGHDQISRTFWCGPQVLRTFWTRPNMTKYQGPFPWTKWLHRLSGQNQTWPSIKNSWMRLGYLPGLFGQDRTWPEIKELLPWMKHLHERFGQKQTRPNIPQLLAWINWLQGRFRQDHMSCKEF